MSKRFHAQVLDILIPAVAQPQFIYTPPTLNEQLAQVDKLALAAVVDNVSGAGATFTARIEHSPDGFNWVAKNSPVEIPALGTPAGAVTLLPGGPGGFLPRGSHGSERAELPHSARRGVDSLRGVPTHDARFRERESLQHAEHVLPIDVPSGGAAREPLLPGTPRLSVEARERTVVRRDAEVSVMPAELVAVHPQGTPRFHRVIIITKMM